MSKLPQMCFIGVLLGVISLSGCKSLNVGGKGPKDGKFKMPPAPADDWIKVGMDNGLSYIRVADTTEDDVITLFATTDDASERITSMGVLVKHIQNKGHQGLKAVEMNSFRGVPGVRFEIIKRDIGMGGSEEMRAKLGLMERQPGSEYFVRTEVFAFPDPRDNTKIVNLGISRVSVHGMIGNAYSNVRNLFVSQFLSMNDIPGYNGDTMEAEYDDSPEDSGLPY